MKNLMFLAIAALFLFTGCAKENLQEPAKLTSEQAQELFKARVEQIILQIEKAGVFSQNPTMGSQNQAIENRSTCNRVPICHNGNTIVVNNSAVPAHLAHGDQLTCCETPCINESPDLINGGPWEWYYDGAVNSCFGVEELVILATHHSFIVAELYAGSYYVYSHNHVDHSGCFAVVTQAEFECALAYLRSVIAANSCIPNICD